jgi:TetR/AcrR family transcriptional regulator, cholesterol catabolism regulator
MQIEKRFHELISEVAGLSDPTDADEAVIRLLVHQWFGCIQVCLNGGLTVAQAEADLRRAAQLLTRDWRSVGS